MYTSFGRNGLTLFMRAQLLPLIRCPNPDIFSNRKILVSKLPFIAVTQATPMSSSSDEAPEETTFDGSKAALRQQANRARREVAQSRQLAKQKRRERDFKLKQQQQASSKPHKKLLSEILQESGSEEDETSGNSASGTSSSEQATSQLEPKIRIPSKTQKKLFTEKDGFIVKVSKPAKSSKKSLPPSGSDALRKREMFLFRESVPRR